MHRSPREPRVIQDFLQRGRFQAGCTQDPRAPRKLRRAPCFALGSLVLALGRPAVVLSVPTNQTTIILAIDVSGSMCSGDISPNRLVAAETAAISFIRSQKATTRIGIVAFSGEALTQVPLTTDYPVVQAALSGYSDWSTSVDVPANQVVQVPAALVPVTSTAPVPTRAGLSLTVPLSALAAGAIVMMAGKRK